MKRTSCARRSGLLCLAVSTLGVVPPAITPVAATAPSAAEPETSARPVPDWMTAPITRPGGNPTITLDQGGASTTPTTTTVRGATERVNGRTRTYFEAVATADTPVAALRAAGFTVEGEAAGILLVSTQRNTAADLGRVAGITSVRTPVDMRAGAIEARMLGAPQRTEYTASSNLYESREFLLHGYTGTGIKVGIIDFFDPAVMPGQQASGDIPNIPADRRQCWYLGATCPFGTPGVTHGNNVLEVMVDAAPTSEYYLAEVGTITDYLKAIDWFAANGVTVVNHSLAGPYDGPGDGTGASAYVVDYAVSKGIAWFNAAGNAGADPQYTSYQGGYWRGTWSDPDLDRWLNFNGTDESLGVYCGALMGMRWSDWGALRSDYDLFVSDFRITTGANSSTKYTVTAYNQLAGSPPLEGNDMRWLCNHTAADGPVYDVNGDNFVSLWVQRKKTSPAANSAGDIIELMVNAGWFEYSASGGSAAIPFADSKNPGMSSVGAALGMRESEGYSAHGPTNDGRVKPDISNGGCMDTSLDGACPAGGFAGTSAASPAIASKAILLRQVMGPAQPWQIQQAIRNTGSSYFNYGWDHGVTGAQLPNNTVGWGIGNLVGEFPGSWDSGTMFVAMTPQRMLDTRAVSHNWAGPKPMLPGSSVNLMAQTVPHSAVALAVNIAIVGATQPGYAQLYPSKMGLPGGSSNVNASAAGQTVANFAIVPYGFSEVTLFNQAGGHVIVDVVGYFVTSYDGKLLNTTVPTRLHDSRCGTCSPMVAGQSLDVQVLGTGVQSVPFEHVPTTGVSAAIVNITVDSPVAGKGYLSAVPQGTSWPVTTSTINFNGKSTSGVAIVQIPPGQDSIRLFSSVATHVQVDVLGYFADTAPGGYFFPVTPARFADTRLPAGSPRPAAGSTTNVQVGGRLGVPADAGSVFYNLTVVKSTGTGEAQVVAGLDPPTTTYRSIAIGAPDGAVANAGFTAVHGGNVSIVASTATHRILDIAGWFSGGETPLPAGTISPMRTTAGAVPDGYTWATDVSHDGRYVAIHGTSTNLVPGTDGTIADIVVWDRVTNTYERANLGDNEEVPDILGVSSMSMSADGTKVAFMSMATNLVPNDTNNRADLFIRDLVADTTVRVPIEPTDSINVVDANFALSISEDMETIVYSTRIAALPVDTDGWGDVYVFQRSTNTLELAISPIQPAYSGWTPFVMSADGSTVADGTQVWREGIGATAAPFGSMQLNSLSADGGTAITSTTTGGTGTWNTTFFTIDIASGVATQLCTSTTVYLGMKFAGNGPRSVASGGCGADRGGVWVNNGASTANVFRSWNGVLPDGTIWNWAISGDGSTVIFVTNSFNLLSDFTPTTVGSWVYVHEVPEP